MEFASIITSLLRDLRATAGWIGRKSSHIGDNESRAIRRAATTASNLGSSAGFTLVELLVVIVILGVLAATVVFAIGGQSGVASSAVCRSDLRTVESAQETYLAQTGSYATGIDQLVEVHLLRSAPSSDSYQIATDTSGAVVAAPGCDALDVPNSTTAGAGEPASKLSASCSTAVDTVTAAQGSYRAATGAYAPNVTALVTKGYLAADPSTVGYKITTTNKGIAISKPGCANISDVACDAAVAEVQAAQQARFTKTGKYGSNIAQLVKDGYLGADPSTDAYKIKTTNKDVVTATPDCAALA